jgi:hypothetical protein
VFMDIGKISGVEAVTVVHLTGIERQRLSRTLRQFP